MIRSHVRWSHTLAHRLAAEPGFSLVAQPVLSLFSFFFFFFAHNLSLVTTNNNNRRLYLTQTKVEGASRSASRPARLKQQWEISTLLSMSSVGWLASCSNKG